MLSERTIAISNPRLDELGLRRLGPHRLAAYRSIGIETVREFLAHLPARYRERLAPRPISEWRVRADPAGESAAIRGRVVSYRSGRRRGTPSRLVVEDESGRCEALSFALRRVPRAIGHGAYVYLLGRSRQTERGYLFTFDHYETADEDLCSRSHLPIYHLPPSVPPRLHREFVEQILRGTIEPLFPSASDEPSDLVPLHRAIVDLHMPQSNERIEAARRRIAFEELRAFVVPWIDVRRRTFRALAKPARSIDGRAVEAAIAALPFQLTQDQRRALIEIVADLNGRSPMHRLLHGEVGAGKTAVALLATRMIVAEGRQAALLAPTALLAEQLAGVAGAIFASAPEMVALFTKATPIAQRRRIALRLRSGEPLLLIGTLRSASALAQAASLGLVVVDEQHRFGVAQRARLRVRPEVDFLVMTATPIPRSLALTLYGDLDLSVLRTLPPGRLAVETHAWTRVVAEGDAGRSVADDLLHQAVECVRAECARGGRVFVLCPRVQGAERGDRMRGSESNDDGRSDPTWSVTRVATLLRRVGMQTGIAFGSAEPGQNARALERFRSGAIEVLVASTVIEVGIDVREATLIVVLGADRFGLAQLHQLRGRVGRGDSPGRCILVAATRSAAVSERLERFVNTRSGFEVAELDLEQRGTGELDGLRQHGDLGLRFARLPRDLDLLVLARDEAARRPDCEVRSAWPTRARSFDEEQCFPG